MRSLLETPRTLLRPFSPEDTEAVFSWMSDTEVMRFIPNGPDHTPAQTSARIARYIAHQEAHGFSKWIILDRVSNKPIGDAGFFLLPDEKRIELGYRLTRSHWGIGLATEVASRWIEVADDFFSEQTIFAFAHPENKSSLHVMTKLGFTFLRNESLYGLDAPLFSLEVKNES
jgi:ribosomal-protein-alanine N-acetyltransferase